MVLSIVMPAFNEKATVRRAVTHVLEVDYPCEIELIIVDDGSTDGTLDELDGIRDRRLRTHRHTTNQGKGAALRTAISLARGTHLLPFDADLEYSAFDIPRLLQPILEGRTTVVYGVRMFGMNTVYQSFRYKLGNMATTLAANLLFDSALTDLHTCFKLVPLPVLREMLLEESRFGLDTEITARLLKLGHRPFEVPIAYYARSHMEGKKIKWQDGVRCLGVLVRVRMQGETPALPAPRTPVPLGRHQPAVVDLTSPPVLSGQREVLEA